MKYVKIPIPIDAEYMDEPFTVETLEGTMTGKAGDYLVTGIRGEQYPVDGEIFDDSYIAVPPGLDELLSNANVARMTLVQGLMKARKDLIPG
jgi:hypothetical protein